jgi:hypothetical protein
MMCLGDNNRWVFRIENIPNVRNSIVMRFDIAWIEN